MAHRPRTRRFRPAISGAQLPHAARLVARASAPGLGCRYQFGRSNLRQAIGTVGSFNVGRHLKRSWRSTASPATTRRYGRAGSRSTHWTRRVRVRTRTRGSEWSASCAHARCRHPAGRGPMRRPIARWQRRSSTTSIWHGRPSRIRAASARCIGSIAPSTRMRFATCSDSTSTPGRCCPATRLPTAVSIISPMRCRSRRRISSATCQSLVRSAGSRRGCRLRVHGSRPSRSPST